MVECAVPIHLRLHEPPHTSLTFSYLQLDSSQSSYLTQLVEKSVHLREFHLQSCPLAAETVSEVAVALGRCEELERLVWVRCQVEVEHCVYLTQGLGTRSLLELNLTGNDIGNDGLSLLLGLNFTCLESLTLRKCSLTVGAKYPLTSLLTSAAHLQFLDLACNQLTDECVTQVFWRVGGLKHLHTFILSDTALEDSAIHSLSSLPPSLRTLDLSHNSLTNLSFPHLSSLLLPLPHFSRLLIRSNLITDDCLPLLTLKAQPIIPTIDSDMGTKWTFNREKCAKCRQFCVGLEEICRWLRRRPALRVFLRLRKLNFD